MLQTILQFNFSADLCREHILYRTQDLLQGMTNVINTVWDGFVLLLVVIRVP